jgi:hypothetical protein
MIWSMAVEVPVTHIPHLVMPCSFGSKVRSEMAGRNFCRFSFIRFDDNSSATLPYGQIDAIPGATN